MKPLAIDLFCGLGGWTDGLLAEGYDVVGFDIEQRVYGEHRYPGILIIQDVLTLHGSQFKRASLIVASPPCQKYSYMAMPWTKAKQMAAEYRSGVRDVKELNALFDACFRIQREACQAAGRHIPLIVENVRGAVPWVGRSRWNFGSFHLWGDVPALMPPTLKAHKVPGFRFDGSGRSFQTASVNHHDAGLKNGNGWFGTGENVSLQRRYSHGSAGRKMASAMIAKIPLPLSRHIAAAYHPFHSAARAPLLWHDASATSVAPGTAGGRSPAVTGISPQLAGSEQTSPEGMSSSTPETPPQLGV